MLSLVPEEQIDHMQHLTMYLENISFALVITDIHTVIQKHWLVYEERKYQEVIYYSKYFNSNYIDFIGYEKCDKLICTSGECCRNTNTISKQEIPKSNINKIYTSSTLGFGCSPYKDTCNILSGYFVLYILQ